jgi:cytochrome P450
MATATNEPVRLPPGLRIPKTIQGMAFLTAMCEVVPALGRRYGSTFTANLPVFGKTVMLSDPVLVKDVFGTSSDLIERPTNLGQVFGPGSTFSLNGPEHAERRRLLLPAFHGKRVASYERIVEEEVMRETASWPEGREFEALPSTSRLTLNAILRAVFGEEQYALNELRRLLPATITVGSVLHQLPSVLGRDFGRWSPGGRLLRYRRRIDAVMDSLIAKARADPNFEDRSRDNRLTIGLDRRAIAPASRAAGAACRRSGRRRI